MWGLLLHGVLVVHGEDDSGGFIYCLAYSFDLCRPRARPHPSVRLDHFPQMVKIAQKRTLFDVHYWHNRRKTRLILVQRHFKPPWKATDVAAF